MRGKGFSKLGRKNAAKNIKKARLGDFSRKQEFRLK